MEVCGVFRDPQAKEPLLPSEQWNFHVTHTSHNIATISVELELLLVVSSC